MMPMLAGRRRVFTTVSRAARFQGRFSTAATQPESREEEHEEPLPPFFPPVAKEWAAKLREAGVPEPNLSVIHLLVKASNRQSLFELHAHRYSPRELQEFHSLCEKRLQR